MLNNKINMEQHQVLLGDLKKQRTKEYNQAWYETRGKEYYNDNRKRINNYYREQRCNNEQYKEYRRMYMRQYYNDNKDRINQQARERYRNKKI